MTNAQGPEPEKEAAVQFLQHVVAGRIEEAYERYVDMRGTHHNPFFRAGFSELRRAMIEDHVQHPSKQIQVKHVIGDGDMVAVHSRLVLEAGGAHMAVVHLFRFRDHRIVELWDCGMAVPADSPNNDGAF
jgi:predicted SnoaL-like aldol condensation-catalyzing enzyme